MAKTDAERGPVAVWLRNERHKRNWTNDDVVRALAARGYHITEMSYRGYEAGPKVSAPLRHHLEAIYKSKPPDTTKEATEPVQLSGLIAALEAQTAAITRLATAMERIAPRLADDEEFVAELGNDGALPEQQPVAAHQTEDPPVQDEG